MKRPILFLLAAGGFLLPGTAGAATLVVDRTDDTAFVGACTSDPNDCSLRGAIINANVTDGADTITLPAGTYVLSVAGVDENEAATGDLDITDDLTLNGAGAKTTIIDGGAIDRVFHISPTRLLLNAPSVTINDVTVTNGLAPSGLGDTRGNGGGLSINANNEAVTLNRVIVRGNAVGDASAVGGGIYLVGSFPDVTITRSTIEDNEAGTDGSGGGLYIDLEGGSATIANCTIAGNEAGQRGGGLYALDVALLLNNDTIAANVAGTQGGGITVDSASVKAVKVRNTLLAGNAASSDADCDGTVVSQGYNLVTDATGCSGIPGTNDLVGDDPLLDPLGLKNNGGPTPTIALLAGSPAINAGNDDSCRSHDQRGLIRPQGAHCDVGAFEKGFCGDKFLEPEEQCDDGNATDGDGCSAACVDEVPGADCGNGAVEGSEECDDGNAANGDGCSSACVSESSSAVCGNSVVETEEDCDDGNTEGGDGCSATCQSEEGGSSTGGGGGGGCSLISNGSSRMVILVNKNTN